MQKLTAIERILLFAAALDPNLYVKCTPTEKYKLLMNGGFVCIPACMALFSGIFASKWLFDDILSRAVLVLFYVMLIFFLDRAILMYTKTGEFNFAMLVRAILAIALSLIMAEPIVLQIFRDEILADESRQISEILAHERSILQAQIKPIEAEITKNDSIMNVYLYELNLESNGQGGSKKYGIGPIFAKRQYLYDEKKREVDISNKAKIDHIHFLRNQSEDRAKSELGNVATGLSGKYNRLAQLAKASPAIYLGSMLWRIVLILFDILPLLLKLIKPKRREDLYPFLLQQQHDGYFDAINTRRKEDYQTILNDVQNLSQQQLKHSQSKCFHDGVDDLKSLIQQLTNDGYDIYRIKKEAEMSLENLDDKDLKKSFLNHLNQQMKAYYAQLEKKP